MTQDVAKGLSLAAYWKSIQISCETPFSHSVRDSGGVSYGGKPDDITVRILIDSYVREKWNVFYGFKRCPCSFIQNGCLYLLKKICIVNFVLFCSQVMAAWVVSAKDENTPTLLERCQLERKLMQR